MSEIVWIIANGAIIKHDGGGGGEGNSLWQSLPIFPALHMGGEREWFCMMVSTASSQSTSGTQPTGWGSLL